MGECDYVRNYNQKLCLLFIYNKNGTFSLVYVILYVLKVQQPPLTNNVLFLSGLLLILRLVVLRLYLYQISF